MILHIIRQSSASHQSLHQCLKYKQTDDGILFISDGVLNLCLQHNIPLLKTPELSNKLFVLESDLTARNLPIHSLDVKQLSYQEFVELTLQYEKTLTW
ncbi:sulfurtransferase complex subunit TusB [Paraneptunicella aestuarii]|uniref:sulfurtransferase complex subunit TusB n=1 Tax=Paraneptunicella aestuarii TaxID=2831148 RepID=UPI001E3B8279|nr:sulfurtransferase complex subunit TusB [Paraneptunicella aestuarii]UAA37299.1 sulfurtransferase complex subunit TusB [Paraneptunicella aestuarii]